MSVILLVVEDLALTLMTLTDRVVVKQGAAKRRAPRRDL